MSRKRDTRSHQQSSRQPHASLDGNMPLFGRRDLARTALAFLFRLLALALSSTPGSVRDDLPFADKLDPEERVPFDPERWLRSPLARGIGRRHLLRLLGGRPTGTPRGGVSRGMARLALLSRAGEARDGTPTRITLSVLVLNTRREGEIVRWRTSERTLRGRPVSYGDHRCPEAALLAYAPTLP